MKLVYIAAPFDKKGEAALVKSQLEEAGIAVISTWVADKRVQVSPGSRLDSEIIRTEAVRDRIALDHCTILLYLADLRPSTSGGMDFELGYAYARGKAVYVVGEADNIFAHLPGIRHVTLSEFLEEVGA